MIDYHIHTPLCNHAIGSMVEYIKKAVEIGLEEICFLDHLTLSESGSGLSMSLDEVSLYFHAIQVLKQKYNNLIGIKAGLEIDFNPAFINIIEDVVNTFSFDVIGSSLHFVGGLNVVSSKSSWKRGLEDTDHVYRLYFEYLEKMLDYDYFDVVCHFDMIKKFGKKPIKSFDKEIDNLLLKISDKNLVVEVNTSGLNHQAQEIYPAFNIIKKCIEADIMLTLGSDAHSPEDVGRHFDKVLDLLRSAGCSYLTAFDRRSRRKISIV